MYMYIYKDSQTYAKNSNMNYMNIHISEHL